MSQIDYNAINNYLSRKQLSEAEKVLATRNILDPDSSNFAKNYHSLNLRTPEEIGSSDMPRVILAITPVEPEPNKVDTASEEFNSWVDKNTTGLDPLPDEQFIFVHHQFVHQNGKTYFKGSGGQETGAFDYYHMFLNNLYLEHGMSTCVVRGQSSDQLILMLRNVVARLWMLANFASAYYQEFGYKGESLITFNATNVKGVALGGFHGSTGKSKWAEPYDFINYEDPPTNKIANNIQIKRQLGLNDAEVIEHTIKDIAKELSNCFGESIIKCFNDDDSFASNGLRL